jgi:arylsulfatase A-like enzyme
VAQVLNRLTYTASLSHIRRVNTPLEKSGELIAPRKLHGTTMGYLCFVESPEGQSVGVVKNISMMTHITIPTQSTALYEYVKPYILSVEDAESPTALFGKVKVFVNGSWVGIAKEPMALYQNLKEKKQPWYLAVNIVNPHDVAYYNSDLPTENQQQNSAAIPVPRAPTDDLYKATWDSYPLPESRKQALDAPGRPAAHKIYQEAWNAICGNWPNEDRRWRSLLNYYFNCIRDSDENVAAVMQGLKDSGMEDNTIVIFTADHGELGGSHQMRGKGTTAYKEQNHLPLMIIHPAYPGGKECKAVTSQVDLATTIISLTGKDAATRKKAAAGLPGRDLVPLLKNPESANLESLRPGALYNFNMLSFVDAKWARRTYPWMFSGHVPTQEEIKILTVHEPNFSTRSAMRSASNGRYRFSRYFSPLKFNMPTTFEELIANNDLELFDLQNDPAEINNLAMNPKQNAELIMAMNKLTNELIAQEVGVDDGSFLPIRNGKWYFPAKSQR